jgi:hypothetical protein
MSRGKGKSGFLVAFALLIAVGLLTPTGCSSSSCSRCPSSPKPGGDCCLAQDAYCTYRQSATAAMGCSCDHGKYTCTQERCPASQPASQSSCSPYLKLLTCNYGSAACNCLYSGAAGYFWTCS